MKVGAAATATATMTVKHSIQHRHDDIVAWIDKNCDTPEKKRVAALMVRFIVTRFPETASVLNGELQEWET